MGCVRVCVCVCVCCFVRVGLFEWSERNLKSDVDIQFKVQGGLKFLGFNGNPC